jgi:hypothetical protein
MYPFVQSGKLSGLAGSCRNTDSGILQDYGITEFQSAFSAAGFQGFHVFCKIGM